MKLLQKGKGQSRGVETSLGQMSNLTNEGTPEDRWVGHRVSQILMLGCNLFTVEVSLLWGHNTWGSTTDYCPKLKVMVLASIWASTAGIITGSLKQQVWILHFQKFTINMPPGPHFPASRKSLPHFFSAPGSLQSWHSKLWRWVILASTTAIALFCLCVSSCDAHLFCHTGLRSTFWLHFN